MQLDIRADDARPVRLPDARGPPLASIASCGSYILAGEIHSEDEPWTALGISRATWYRRSRPPHGAQLEPISAEHWYAIQTARGDERKADIAIRLAGITLFAPTFFKAATPARRGPGGGYRPARIARIEYLFWRVMFIRLNLADPGWRDVLELTGPAPGDDPFHHVVDCFLCWPGTKRPEIVRDSAIDWVRGLLAPNGCLYPPRYVMAEDIRLKGTTIEAGVPLRFLDGPMAGQEAICEWSDGDRVKLRSMMMGSDRRMNVARSSVEIV